MRPRVDVYVRWSLPSHDASLRRRERRAAPVAAAARTTLATVSEVRPAPTELSARAVAEQTFGPFWVQARCVEPPPLHAISLTFSTAYCYASEPRTLRVMLRWVPGHEGVEVN